MATNYNELLEQLKDAYANLLIVQYHDKPNAIATVKANIEILLSNMLLWKIRDCWDIDDTELCVGSQLDIIGRWVGVDRFYTEIPLTNIQFALIDWNEISGPNALQGGLQDWNNLRPETDGGFLNYYSIVSVTSRMDDNNFRIIIKLKIIKNNIVMTCKNIDDAIFDLFGVTVYTGWGTTPMMMTYHFAENSNAIMELAKKKNCLPIPTGCDIEFDNILVVDGGSSLSNQLNAVDGGVATIIIFEYIMDGGNSLNAY